jgi:hypothetical protein
MKAAKARRSGGEGPAAAAAAAAGALAPAAPQLKSIGLQLRKDSSLICYIFVKRHQQGAEEPAAAQQQQQQQQDEPEAAAQQQQHKHAVFVAGLPLDLEEDDLAAVFSCFGDVAQVVLHTTKARAARHGTARHGAARGPPRRPAPAPQPARRPACGASTQERGPRPGARRPAPCLAASRAGGGVQAPPEDSPS